MPHRVVLSTEANRDLEQIAKSIAVDRPRAARQVVRESSRKFGMLRERPHLGPAAPETAQPDMRRLSSPPYIIFYRVKPDMIQVSRILHGSRYLQDPSLYEG